MKTALSHALVTLDDLPVLLHWWQDAAGMSLLSSSLREHHARDLALQLQDPSIHIYKFMCDGTDVGMVRAELSVREWELQWYIDPARRGQGLSEAMALTIVERLKGCFAARIKPDNTRSLKVARALGFFRTGRDGEFEVWRLYRHFAYHQAPPGQFPMLRWGRLSAHWHGLPAKSVAALPEMAAAGAWSAKVLRPRAKAMA